MSDKPSESLAQACEAALYPILNAWPEFWWMPQSEKTATVEALARMNGGRRYLPREGRGREYEQ
jgi:hypothetical protein